jgi:hypothetical protein
MKNIKSKQGYSNLVLVFMISTFMSLILFAMLLGSYLDAKRVSQVIYSKQTYYAAEGAMNNTLQIIKNNGGWNSVPDTSTYTYADADIKRNIFAPVNNPNCSTKVDINASYKTSKRRMVACFSSEEGTETVPTDIVLILDRSGSMCPTAKCHYALGYPVCDKTPSAGDPLMNAIEAAEKFVQKVREGNGDFNIGLVTYTENSSKNSGLTNQYDILYNPDNGTGKIGNIECGTATNIQAGIIDAKEILDKGDEGSKKVMVVLSDGRANLSESDCFAYTCAEGYKPHVPGTEFDGIPGANCHTHNAIEETDGFKSEDFVVFSVFLCNNCNPMGPETMLEISSEEKYPNNKVDKECNDEGSCTCDGEICKYYYETKNKENLDEIYEEIAEKIIESSTVIKFREEAPEPDPS